MARNGKIKMNEKNRISAVIWWIVVALVLLMPFIMQQNKYMMHIGIQMSFNVALATSMWLIWTLGFVSFAHAGFMGIGAYTTALLFLRLGWPIWINIWIGALLAGLVASLISLPLMRTRAVYFFMASWAVGEVIKRIFAMFRRFFGGWDGLLFILPPKLSFLGLHIDFSSRVAYYYLAVVFAMMVVFLVYRINRSRTGTIFWSIHEAEILAQHVGINVLRYKVLAFTVACTFAAMTGALYAHYHTFINPKSFDIWVSEFALVHIIVGGLATVAGPVLGAIVLTAIDEALRPAGYYRVILFGVVLILTVLFMPGGLESIPRRIRALAERLRKNEGGGSKDATT